MDSRASVLYSAVSWLSNMTDYCTFVLRWLPKELSMKFYMFSSNLDFKLGRGDSFVSILTVSMRVSAS